MIKPGRMKSKPRSNPRQAEEASVADRLWYLIPNRYFRFFFLYDRHNHQSCWIPEGFSE